MDRSEFLKTLGLAAGGITLPNNTLVNHQSVKIYDNYIKGVTHYDIQKVKNHIKEGDELTLCREADNLYDGFAISVAYQFMKLGYIAAYENIVLANMLDEGIELKAFVSKKNKDDIYNTLAIEVYAKIIVPTDKLVTLIKQEKRADDMDDIYRKGII